MCVSLCVHDCVYVSAFVSMCVHECVYVSAFISLCVHACQIVFFDFVHVIECMRMCVCVCVSER